MTFLIQIILLKYVNVELGVYPLIIERKMRVIKYWLKIIRNINGKEHFVQKVYKELLNINNTIPNCLTWVSGIK